MGTATISETAVLAALAPGGMLTAGQLIRDAQLTRWSIHRAISQLEARGLIVALPHAARWSMTPRGQLLWAIEGREGSR